MTIEYLPPVIETERLRLRPHRINDLTDCVTMWSDPAITRYTIGEPSSPQRTWVRMLAYRGHWALLGFGYWAVEEKRTGAFLGELGFADFKRTTHPSLGGMPELGWALLSHAHGKGYATEGLRAAVAWSDGHFGLIRTACIIHPENHASFRVADKLGYTRHLATSDDGGAEIVLIRSPELRG